MGDLPEIVYLNGKIQNASEAKISIFDYGFLFGAGVYDVALLCEGLLFQGNEHLERFYKSAASVGIPITETKEEVFKIISELVAKTDVKDGIVYLQATFGAYGKRSHKLPASVNSPTLVVFIQYLAPYPASYFTEGVDLISEPEFRWTKCNIKATTLLPAVLAMNSLPENAAESVFYDPESKIVRECAASNIFCVKDGVLYTPPLSKYILPGIERQTILNIAKANNIPTKEEDFTLDFLLKAEEVFMSSTTKEVLPIKKVDSISYTNTPGPVTKNLIKLFVEYVEKELKFVHPKRKNGVL